MKRKSCPQEAAVTRAARAGQWEEALRAHAARCAYCRDIAQAAGWMQSLAQRDPANLVLPDAGLLWWKAQLAQRQAEAERARKPLEWIEALTEASIPLGLAGGFAWLWSWMAGQWPELLGRLWPEVWRAAWSAANAAPTALSSAAVPAAVVIVSVAAVLVYPLLAEE